MARKNLLAGLTEMKLTAVNSENSPPAAKSPPLAFAGRAALGAVTRSIDDLAARAHAAKELEARLTAGQVIVELDPALVDPSFISDRMGHDDEAYQAIRSAIAAQGQESPILVRPHPSASGRYQVAFGHRRLRAAKDLGRAVRAVVRTLTDQDLVLAQGQENSARTDLSFIERARFAKNLEDAGYDREIIMSALTVDKTTVSRMISVTTRIPAPVINAIGPAAGTGRDRWVDLAGHFHATPNPANLDALLESETFQKVDSDARFHHVLSLFTSTDYGRDVPTTGQGRGQARSPRSDAQFWAPPDGTQIVTMTYHARSCVMAIDRRVAPGFGDYLLTQMDRLFNEYMAVQDKHRSEDSDVSSGA